MWKHNCLICLQVFLQLMEPFLTALTENIKTQKTAVYQSSVGSLQDRFWQCIWQRIGKWGGRDWQSSSRSLTLWMSETPTDWGYKALTWRCYIPVTLTRLVSPESSELFPTLSLVAATALAVLLSRHQMWTGYFQHKRFYDVIEITSTIYFSLALAFKSIWTDFSMQEFGLLSLEKLKRPLCNRLKARHLDMCRKVSIDGPHQEDYKECMRRFYLMKNRRLKCSASGYEPCW